VSDSGSESVKIIIGLGARELSRARSGAAGPAKLNAQAGRRPDRSPLAAAGRGPGPGAAKPILCLRLGEVQYCSPLGWAHRDNHSSEQPPFIMMAFAATGHSGWQRHAHDSDRAPDRRAARGQ
jgi:hypothetical protein